jgi:Rps23 Pro-64 3,4-dihydroxylase Tpa1-like proline 4-hydroxylase
MQEIKVIKKFFNNEDLKIIKEYCDDIFDNNNSLFKASHYWNPILLKSVKSDVLSYRLTETIDNEIYRLIYSMLVSQFDFKIKEMHFYYFLQESNIQWHDEGYHAAGATIYLNQKWNKEDGGFFLYQKKNEDISIILPEMNKCIFQSGAVEHATTPTFNHSPVRKSIQVFFK